MCCQIENHRGCRCRDRHHGGSCDCDELSHFERRFLTKEEEIAELEQYLENLQMEAKAVEEHMAALKEK